MITIKSNTYSKPEIIHLLHLFQRMEHYMQRNCKEGVICKTCEYRHICYDITSCKEHLIKLSNEVYRSIQP